MRYDKGHKEESRLRIMTAAAGRFRKEGVDAVGVAAVMGDAGLTHGGFYAHFTSKEDLAAAALAQSLTETGARLKAAGEAGGLAAIMEAYLSPAHRDRPETGCAVAALGGELARHPEPTRAALAAGVEGIVAILAAHMAGGDEAERNGRAMAVFAALVGTLQLARLVPDGDRSTRILAEGRRAALALAANDVPS